MRHLIIVALLFLCTPLLQAASVQAERLTCEFSENPLGIDIIHPVLGWQLRATERNQIQTAYEIVMGEEEASVKKGQGNAWTSGVIKSAESNNIIYEGVPLQSFTRYYWKVRVYDREGNASAWSSVAWFETAMLQASDWKAAWINDGKALPTKDEDFYKEDPMPGFKRVITIKKAIRSARLYVAGAGYYEAYLNGQKVGTAMLAPGWTNFDKRILYKTYDITEQLKTGENVAGLLVGNGWYNPLPLRFWSKYNLRDVLAIGRPAVKAQYRITYTDGSVDDFFTGNDWAYKEGPVVKNSVYLGETFDANKDINYWLTSHEMDMIKTAAVVSGPKGRLVADLQPAVRTTRVIKPIAIKELTDGRYVVDMGENVGGVARIKLNAPKGTRVVLRYGEDIYKDGAVNGMTAVAGQIKSGNGGPGAPEEAYQEDCFIASGNGEERWNPRFTFHIFRYVEISGWPGKPSTNDIEALVMHSDVSTAGSFESANPLFNKIQENVLRTFKSNIFSVQSDCAGREKFGYGGDLFCTLESFCYNFDMHNFYRKSLQDFEDDQRPLGGITETAPFVGLYDKGPGDLSGPLGWQLGYPYLVQKLYDFYGDKRMIERYYPSLTRQINFLIDSAKAYLYEQDISDHESLDQKPEALTASLFYLHHVLLMKGFAQQLGKSADVKKYAALTAAIQKAILRKFYKGNGVFDSGTQAAQLFPLWYALVNGVEKQKTITRLKQAFAEKKQHLTTGIFATKMLFDVLRELDANELAYAIANQRDFPGWGYMVENGATSIWETWKYSDNTYSQSHPMFGSITEWFYRSLLGINATGPAFKTFLIKPQPIKDLHFAKGYYETLYGKIMSDWKWEGDRFRLSVTVPVNTTATIWLPANDPAVLLDGQSISGTNGPVAFVREKSGYRIYKVGSGVYTFESQLKK